MMNKDFEDIDDKVLDMDEVEGTDLKINPDYYVHNALVKAQAALAKDNVQEGFAQFRMFIENMEVLCRAADMLPKDYEDQLKDYKDKAEYKDEKADFVKGAKLANFKLGLMMKLVFKRKTLTDPLKDRSSIPS